RRQRALPGSLPASAVALRGDGAGGGPQRWSAARVEAPPRGHRVASARALDAIRNQQSQRSRVGFLEGIGSALLTPPASPPSRPNARCRPLDLLGTARRNEALVSRQRVHGLSREAVIAAFSSAVRGS